MATYKLNDMTSGSEALSLAAPATRRDFLFVATGVAAAGGALSLGAAFVGALAPDAETVASGTPVDLDLGPIAEGQIAKLFWRGRLVFVRHRTDDEISAARATPLSMLVDPESDERRTKPGEARWLVVYGSCTHLGCVPLGPQGPYGGWFCPCHGSVFDTSGRVRRGPAPINLPVPPYFFFAQNRIRIGAERA